MNDDVKSIEGLAETIEWVPISKVISDHRVNTRPIDGAWVDRRVDAFDPNLLGVPIVSRRADGTFVVLDGQNRFELCKRAGYGDQQIECRVFDGLALAQEAVLFLGHNDGRAVNAYSKFMAQITAGDLRALRIQRIVQDAGWDLSYFPAERKVVAVAAMGKVYDDGMQSHPDVPGASLKLVFDMVTRAWGYSPDSVNGSIISGLGRFMNRFGAAVDTAALARRLQEYPGGAMGLLSTARGIRAVAGGTITSAVAEKITEIYNKRRSAGRVPDWRSGARPMVAEPREELSGE